MYRDVAIYEWKEASMNRAIHLLVEPIYAGYHALDEIASEAMELGVISGEEAQGRV